MYVTIISDASYCDTSGCAGFGSWVACERGRKAYGSTIKRATNSGVAEAMGICNALAFALRDGLVRKGDYVLIQCDALDGIRIVKGESLVAPIREEVYKWFKETIETFKLKTEFRHVKGHSKVADNRSQAQRKCDALAYNYMAKARSRKKLKGLRNILTEHNLRMVEERKMQYKNEIALCTVKIDRMLAGIYYD